MLTLFNVSNIALNTVLTVKSVQNNAVKIINRTGSVALFTDVGVKGKTWHTEANKSALHTNTKGWLGMSTNGLSDE